jgi:hypothetical protein
MSIAPRSHPIRSTPTPAERDHAVRVLHDAYLADVRRLVDEAHTLLTRTGGPAKPIEAQREMVWALVMAADRVQNVGQAMEALLFSPHDRAAWLYHEPGCPCLEWDTVYVWCYLAGYAVYHDVIEQLAQAHGLDLAEAPPSGHPGRLGEASGTMTLMQ